MASTSSPRVPTRLLITLEDQSLGIISPITGELLVVCNLPALMCGTSTPPSGGAAPDDVTLESGKTFLTESDPLERPTLKSAVYIPSEGFIYCLDESGDIYVFISCGEFPVLIVLKYIHLSLMTKLFIQQHLCIDRFLFLSFNFYEQNNLKYISTRKPV